MNSDILIYLAAFLFVTIENEFPNIHINAFMKNLFSFLIVIGASYCSFAQKKIVVIGSSTSAGFGATTYDSSWVGRLQHEYKKNMSDGIDTTIINLGRGGYTSYKVMPTGFISSFPGRPLPCVDSNLTKALSFNPDIIIINLPTNDIASSYTETEEMNNLRILIKTIAGRGIRYFITTTQPRNDIDSVHRLELRQLTDSINTSFTYHVLNFWDDLVASDGSFKLRTGITPDGIHPNNYGHAMLLRRVLAKSLFKADSTSSILNIHTEAENFINMNGIGTENTSDTGGGRNVSYIDPGDWMDYNILVPAAGNYKINFRIASPAVNASLQVKKADGSLLAIVKLPKTGGFQVWQTVSAIITLSQGQQTIRLVSSSPQWNNWNINWFDVKSFIQTIPVPVPVMPVITSAPIHIEAEDFVSMSGIATEKTSDTSGGLNVSYIDPNDWMDYIITAPYTGSYNVNFRVASPANNAQLQVKKSDGSLLATVKLPNTGGFQSWQIASATINLVQGKQTIRIFCSSPQWNDWNINWFELFYNMPLSGIASSSDPFRQLNDNETKNHLTINKVFLSSNRLNAEIYAPMEKTGEVSIYSMSGVLVSKEQYSFINPVSHYNTRLGDLRPGIYILTVSTTKGKDSKQFALLK